MIENVLLLIIDIFNYLNKTNKIRKKCLKHLQTCGIELDEVIFTIDMTDINAKYNSINIYLEISNDASSVMPFT